MHLVLARPSTNPAFAPTVGTADTAADFADRVTCSLEAAYRVIELVDDSDSQAMAGGARGPVRQVARSGRHRSKAPP